jgi:hypothetical protein
VRSAKKFLRAAFVCAAAFLLMATAAAAAEFVRLSVTGTNVNLRPQPRAGGAALGRASPKDEFIAEKTTFTASDGSQWYKILFTLDPSGNFRSAASDSRFKGSPPYISAQFVSAAPLSSDDEKRVTSLADESREIYLLDSKGKNPKVYRVRPGGKRVEIKMPEEGSPAVTARLGKTGGITWLCVDDRHEGMEDSRRGVYFFDENDKPICFLPCEASPYAVVFAPDMKHTLLLSQLEYWSINSTADLYVFVEAEKKTSFGFLGGSIQWIDSNRFVFTMLEHDGDDFKRRELHPDLSEASDIWTSIAVMDTDGKLSRLMAATDTADYSLEEADLKGKKLHIKKHR